MTAATMGTGIPAPALRLTLPRVIRAEWLKLASLRSTWWSLAIAGALSIGISLMVASAARDFGAGFAPVQAILMPMQFTMLVAGILGAIAITGEYSTGMIRSTLAAEPRRGVVVVAKALVVAALIAIASTVIFAIAILATGPILAAPIPWDAPAQSVLPLAGGVLSMVVFALIGLSAGFLIRNGAGAIAATVGVLFVLPVVVSMFSFAGDGWRWVVDAGEYLPMVAAQTLTVPESPDAPGALIALLVWAAAGLLASWAMLRSRDA